MNPKIMKNNAYADCGECSGQIARGERCLQLGHYWLIHAGTDNRPMKLHISCGTHYINSMKHVLWGLKYD